MNSNEFMDCFAKLGESPSQSKRVKFSLKVSNSITGNTDSHLTGDALKAFSFISIVVDSFIELEKGGSKSPEEISQIKSDAFKTIVALFG